MISREHTNYKHRETVSVTNFSVLPNLVGTQTWKANLKTYTLVTLDIPISYSNFTDIANRTRIFRPIRSFKIFSDEY